MNVAIANDCITCLLVDYSKLEVPFINSVVKEIVLSRHHYSLVAATCAAS